MDDAVAEILSRGIPSTSARPDWDALHAEIDSRPHGVPAKTLAANIGRLYGALGLALYELNKAAAVNMLQWAEDVFDGYAVHRDWALSIAWQAVFDESEIASANDIDMAIAMLTLEGEKALADQVEALKGIKKTDSNITWSVHISDPDREVDRLALTFRVSDALRLYDGLPFMSDESPMHWTSEPGRKACLLASSDRNEEALAVIETASLAFGADAPTSELQGLRAVILAKSQRFDAAADEWGMSRQHWNARGDGVNASRTLLNRVLALLDGGDITDDLPVLVGMVISDLSLGPPSIEKAYSKLRLASALTALSGSNNELLVQLENKISVDRPLFKDVPRFQVLSLLSEGEICWYLGRIEEAHGIFSEAERLASKHGHIPLKDKADRRKNWTKFTGGRTSIRFASGGRRTSIWGRRPQIQRNPMRQPSIGDDSTADCEISFASIDRLNHLSRVQIILRKLMVLETKLDGGVGFDDVQRYSEILESELLESGVGKGDWWARTRLCRVMALFELDAKEEAGRLLSDDELQELSHPELNFKVWIAKGRVSFARSDLGSALSALFAAFLALDKYRSSMAGQHGFRYLFFRRMLPPLRGLTADLLKSGLSDTDKRSLFSRFTSLVKGRTFEELLALGPDEGTPSAWIGDTDNSSDTRSRYIDELDSDEPLDIQACEERYLEYVQQNVLINGVNAVSPADMTETISGLKDGQAILEIFYDGGNVYTHILDKDGPGDISVIKLRDGLIDEIGGAILEWEAIGNQRLITGFRDRPWRELGEVLGPELYRICTERQVDQLYVVPSGPFCFFPLGALPIDSSDGTTEYFGDLFPMITLPSVSALTRIRSYKGMADDPEAVVFSDPALDLNHAKQELDAVRNLLGHENVHYFVGPEASGRNFGLNWTKGNILMVSAHADSNRNAQLSYIELTGKDKVFSHEISLQPGVLEGTDLVVLSACRSGLVDERVSDEGIGLMSSFLIAGAPLVLSTYWTVDDKATAMLVEKFLENLITNKVSPAESLSRAMRQLRTYQDLDSNMTLPFSNYFFWASFFLSGRQ